MQQLLHNLDQGTLQHNNNSFKIMFNCLQSLKSQAQYAKVDLARAELTAMDARKKLATLRAAAREAALNPAEDQPAG